MHRFYIEDREVGVYEWNEKYNNDKNALVQIVTEEKENNPQTSIFEYHPKDSNFTNGNLSTLNIIYY